jgi:hypothetical protein
MPFDACSAMADARRGYARGSGTGHATLRRMVGLCCVLGRCRSTDGRWPRIDARKSNRGRCQTSLNSSCNIPAIFGRLVVPYQTRKWRPDDR